MENLIKSQDRTKQKTKREKGNEMTKNETE